MPDGKHCPDCGKDIGLWAVVSAGMPNRIRCPHCRARLRYDDALGLTLILMTLASVLAAVGFWAVWLFVPGLGPRLAVFIVAAVAVWLPIEVAASAYMRHTMTLSLAKRK